MKIHVQRPANMGLSTVYLTMLLEASKKQISFNDFYQHSGIKMKNSFLKYLNFSVERKLIKKTHKKINIKKSGRRNVYYKITKRGVQFLNLIR